MQHPGDRFFVVVTIAMGRVRELTGEVGNELTVYALLVRQLGYDHGPCGWSVVRVHVENSTVCSRESRSPSPLFPWNADRANGSTTARRYAQGEPGIEL